MKVVARVDGSDGIREYRAGDVLDYDTQHVRALIMNNLAEPLDDQATRLHEEMENMSEEEWQAHPLASESHWDRGDEIARVEAEREEQEKNYKDETPDSDATASVAVGERARATTAAPPPPVER